MCKVSSSLHFVKGHSLAPPDGAAETYWVPNTDVYVCETGLVIKVEIAGMRLHFASVEEGRAELGRNDEWIATTGAFQRAALLGSSQGPRFGSFIELYGIADTRALIAKGLNGELAG